MESGSVLTKPLAEKPVKKDATETPQMKQKREAAEKRLHDKRQAKAVGNKAKQQKEEAPEATAAVVVDEAAAGVPVVNDASERVDKTDAEEEKKQTQEKEHAQPKEKDEADRPEKEKKRKRSASAEGEKDEGEASSADKKQKKKGGDNDADDDDSSDEDENDWDSKKETNPGKDRFAKVIVGPPHPNKEEEHKILEWWASKVKGVPYWRMPVEKFKKEYRVDVQPWSNNEGWDCEVVRRDTGNPAKIVDDVGKLMYCRIGKYGHCNRIKRYAGDKFAQPVGKAKYSFRKQLINRDPYVDALDPDMLEWAKWINAVGRWVIEQALSTKRFMANLKKDVLEIILNAEKKKIKKAKKTLKQSKKEAQLSQHSLAELEAATVPMNDKQRKAAVVDYIWRKCCRKVVEQQENKHADGQPVIPGSENVQYEQKVWDKVPKRGKRVYKGDPQDDIQIEACEKKYQQYVIPVWTVGESGMFAPRQFGTVDLKDGDEVGTACNFTVAVGGGVAKWDIAFRIEPVEQIFIARKEPRKVEAAESFHTGEDGAADARDDGGAAAASVDGPVFKAAEQYISVYQSTEELVGRKKDQKAVKGGGEKQARDKKKEKRGGDDSDEGESTGKKRRGEVKSDGESEEEEKRGGKKGGTKKQESESEREDGKKKKKQRVSDSEQEERKKKDKKRQRVSDSDVSENEKKKTKEKEKTKRQKKHDDNDDDDAEMKDLVAGLSYQPAAAASRRGKLSHDAADTGGKLRASGDENSDSDAGGKKAKRTRR